MSIRIAGQPYSYETEANAGITLSDGRRWWGTLVKWRPGTTGRWRRFTLVDVHPFDAKAIERGLRAYVLGDVNR